MLLEGHKGHIYGCDFDPTGQSLATCSFDKSIMLWNVYGDCSSFACMHGHTNAVLDVHWAKTSEYVSCWMRARSISRCVLI
jgi:Prp8 binding protein